VNDTVFLGGLQGGRDRLDNDDGLFFRFYKGF